MPQLDFMTFFLQFFTISTLTFWLIWGFLVGFLEVIYLIVRSRQFLFIFLSKYQILSKKFILKIINLTVNLNLLNCHFLLVNLSVFKKEINFFNNSIKLFLLQKNMKNFIFFNLFNLNLTNSSYFSSFFLVEAQNKC